MTKEDAKEMIKMLVRASGNDKNNSITPFVEDVLSIIDKIDTGNSSITYVPNKRDTYIDKCMHDNDMFKIHPEDGPFYEKAPWWMNPNIKIPGPTCYTSKVSTGDPLPSNGYTTARCCED